MPSNKYRKLLFERTSSDGSAVFRFYETGCLVGLDAENLKPRKSGEGGYLRFNNLQAVSPLTVFRLIKRMGDLGVDLRPFMVDYAHLHHHELLKDWLKDRKTEKWTAFAAFRSAVKEARGEITYAEALELVKPQLGLMERAKDLNRLEFMFRPELGFISGDLSKRTNKEGFRTILKTIEARRSDKIFAHHFDRFDDAVELSFFSQARRNDFSSGPTNGLSFLAAGLLTTDELKKFNELCQRATHNDYPLQLDEKLSFLVTYALVKYGAARAVDILMYAKERHVEWLNKAKDGYYSTWRVSFERLNESDGGKISDEAIYHAVDEVDYPFEWSLMISSV